jgi:hypothetical protein
MAILPEEDHDGGMKHASKTREKRLPERTNSIISVFDGDEKLCRT